MKRDEKGIALVIVIFLMGTLSALAVSMMFLAQTETASSRNYRTMSQARYAAEAGVHQMVNYLMSTTYAAVTPASPFTGYGITKSPVTCTGTGCAVTQTATCDPSTIARARSTGCIVIGYSAATTNNPAGTFNSGAAGTLAVNASGDTTNAALGTVTYGAVAILMSMRSVIPYGSSSPSVIQTWLIVSDGTVPPSTTAIVEVSGSLERNYVSSDTYAIFATGAGCGAINLGGTMHTDSYNSSALVGGNPVLTTTNGGVGTNGNLTIGGTVTINGNLDTPRTGVGACNAGTPTALTGSGHADVTGSIVRLPQAKTFPTPAAPSPTPPLSTVTLDANMVTCTIITAANPPPTTPGCDYSGNDLTITTNGANPVLLGNVDVHSTVNLTIQYGTACSAPCTPTPATGTALVNVNSFKVSSNATFTVGPNTSVTMNIAGTSLASGTEPLDFHAGGFANNTFDPSKFQILYAGTGTIEMIGGPNAAATIYAPNAPVIMQGNADFYGSILANTYNAQGNASVHYDSSLASKYFTLGNYMLTSFSWKKY